MSGRYEERYNEKRPVLGFRVSPELKDYLLELQDGSDKTISEIAENVMNDAMMSPNKNPSSNPNTASSNKNDIDGKQPNNNLYENGFNDGFKNGSNHAKKDIKNRLNKDSQKINDKINGLIQQQIKNQKDQYQCYNCEYIQDSPIGICPSCGSSNSWDDHDGGSHLPDFSDFHLHIPILSDLLFGEEIREEESGRETGKGLAFVGGNKPSGQIKKEKDQYQCYNCEYIQDSPIGICPSCGSSNRWD